MLHQTRARPCFSLTKTGHYLAVDMDVSLADLPPYSAGLLREDTIRGPWVHLSSSRQERLCQWTRLASSGVKTCHHGVVECYLSNAAARQLYESIGFRVVNQTLDYASPV